MRKHRLEYYKGYFGFSLFGLFWSIVYIHVKHMSFFTFNKRKQQKKLSCSNKRGRKVFIWIALKQKESKWWDSSQKYKVFSFILYYKMALHQTSQKMFGKSKIYITGQSTQANDYKIIVYSNLPFTFLL